MDTLTAGQTDTTQAAPCVLWEARVVADGERLWWQDVQFLNEDAAESWLPVDRVPGESYAAAWRRARHPGDEEPSRTVAVESIRAGQSFSHEFRVRRKDGRFRWLAEHVRVETLSAGCWRTAGVAVDVTERKEAEEARRRTEELYRTLAQQFPNGAVLLFDPDLLCTLAEGSDLAEVGIDCSTMPGRSILGAFPPESGAVMAPHFRAALTGIRASFRVEVTGRTWLVSTAPVLAPGGAVSAGMAVTQDVTAHQLAEEKLREQTRALEEVDRRRTEFLAVLSHELRNPLGAIRNAYHLVEQRPPADPATAQYLGIIGRQVQQMTRLVEDLLDVSRVASGKLTLRREPLDLTRLVEETVEDYRRGIEASGLTLSLDLPEHPLMVRGDATRLAQALGNLLANAIKFTPAGGRVSLSVEREAESVPSAEPLRSTLPAPRSTTRRSTLHAPRSTAVIRVRDTGVGIGPEMLPRLFEPFSQADRSLDRSSGGLGLGLALVRGVVELHGGQVRVESAGPGRGAEFVLVLPLLEEGAAGKGGRVAGTAPVELHPGATSRRVLVIEDLPDAAETLQDLLEVWGYRVEVAATGPTGVEAARTFRPDVVLCDIGLPGMDGYAVARALREDPTTAPVCLIALSGYGLDEDRRRSEAAGFAAHLTKPVDPDGLRRILAALHESGTPGGPR